MGWISRRSGSAVPPRSSACRRRPPRVRDAVSPRRPRPQSIRPRKLRFHWVPARGDRRLADLLQRDRSDRRERRAADAHDGDSDPYPVSEARGSSSREGAVTASFSDSFAAGVAFLGGRRLWGGCPTRFWTPQASRAPERAAAQPASLPARGSRLGGLAALLAWSLVDVPVLALAGAIGGAYAPWPGRGGGASAACASGSGPGGRRSRSLRTRSRRESPSRRRCARRRDWPRCAARRPCRFHARLRGGGLVSAVDGLKEQGERTADTVALILRASLLELPQAGSRRCCATSPILSERLEAREKARSRASSLQLEAAILALSPIVLLLLVGARLARLPRGLPHAGGTLVGAIGGS